MRKKFWGVGAGALMLALALSVPAAAEPRLPEGLSAGECSLGGLTREEADQAVNDYVSGLASRKITLNMGEDKADTTAGELGLYWSNQDEVNAALDEYQNSNLIRQYMKSADLKKSPESIPLETSVDEEKVKAFIESKYSGLVQAPQDAAITRENGEFVITPSTPGVMIDVEATNAALQEAFQADLKEAVEVEAALTESQPRIRTEDLETIQDLLGTFSTDFSSSSSARATNLQVGAGKINGHVLMPGETLSGYECLQPFTAENGYKNAATYENGQVVDSIGGGVCQIATTLYNAALQAELEITQRQNHSMIVTYVQPSMDAAIAGTVKDIKITNNYSTPIYVEGYTEGRTLTFSIYGKETRPDNRKVEYVSETLSRTGAGAPKEIVDPALAPGARVKVQSAHNGLTSRLWKVVYVDGAEVERTLLNSDTYTASKAIYRVGPPAAAVVVPPEMIPTESQPAETAAEVPAETAPEETVPVETDPSVYGPGIGLDVPDGSVQAPAETAPAETQPAQTEGAAG